MLSKTRLFVAALAAFLVGFPLAEKSFASVGGLVADIIDASIYGSDGAS